MNAVFKTNRLLLRHANEFDAAVLLKLVNQASFIEHIGDKAIYTLDDAKSYIIGPVYLSRLNLQQYVWYLGKAEPM
ncbi:hypothetical protein [Pseudoalteromonas sp. 78C3]|uniref:hypothetical protein n=1 Tax=Pseudoalteromonas sp. 78C3 TaxID=2058300 RepID=UPI003FA722E7